MNHPIFPINVILDLNLFLVLFVFPIGLLNGKRLPLSLMQIFSSVTDS